MVGEALKLTVEDLSVSYDEMPIVRNISFELQKGMIIALVGRSGSGKTTLFHALAGLCKPDSGRVCLDGEDITGCPGKISYMLQKDLLIPEHTVIENVALPLLISHVPKKAAFERAQSHFEQFGIEGTQKKYPSQLSGGMRQRAALLRTYLMDDEVMLLDEPFSALDALTRKDMQEWFLGLSNSLSLSSILVTHDVDEAMLLADQILILGSVEADKKLPSTVVSKVKIDVPKHKRRDIDFAEEMTEIRSRIMSAL